MLARSLSHSLFEETGTVGTASTKKKKQIHDSYYLLHLAITFLVSLKLSLIWFYFKDDSSFHQDLDYTQLTFTYLKSTIETI